MSDEAKEGGTTDAQSSRAVLTSGGQREAQVYATAELRDVHRPTLEMDRVQITDPRRAVTQKSVRPPMPDVPVTIGETRPVAAPAQTPPPSSAHPKPLFAEPILAAKAFATPPPPSVRAGGAIGALPPPSAPPRKLAAPPPMPTNIGVTTPTPPPLPVTPPPLPVVTPPPLPAASLAAPKSVRTPTTTAPAVPSALAKPAPDPDEDIPDRPTLPRGPSGEPALPAVQAVAIHAPPPSPHTSAQPSDPPGGVVASPIPLAQTPTEAPRRRSGAVYVGVAAIALLGVGGAWLALGSRGNAAPIAATTTTPSAAATSAPAPIETAAPVATAPTAAPAPIETAAPAPIETAAPARTAAPIAAAPAKPAPVAAKAQPPAAKPEPKAAPPPPPAAKPEKPAGKRTLFDVEQ